jgi:uncharacterized protein (TIGR02588 family)
MSGQRRASSGEPRRSPAELVSLLFSIVIVGSVALLITFVYLFGDDEPPMLRAEALTGQVWEANQQYYLPVRVQNDGDRFAVDVIVEVELTTNDEGETAQFTIASLAGKDQATGIALFANHPAEGELTIRIVSFLEP